MRDHTHAHTRRNACLCLCDVHQNLSRGVVDMDCSEDRCTIVGDADPAVSAPYGLQDLIHTYQTEYLIGSKPRDCQVDDYPLQL